MPWRSIHLPNGKVMVTRFQALVMFLFVVLVFVVLAGAFQHVTNELRKQEIQQQAAFVFECRARNVSAVSINKFVDQLVVAVSQNKTITPVERAARVKAYNDIRQKVNVCPTLPKGFVPPKSNPTSTP